MEKGPRSSQRKPRKKSSRRKMSIARRAKAQKKISNPSSITGPLTVTVSSENEDASILVESILPKTSPQPGYSHWDPELGESNIQYSSLGHFEDEQEIDVEEPKGKTTSCENTMKNLLYSKFMGSSATKYGIEKEPIAIKEYEANTNEKVKPCGLFVDETLSFLAASPDGLIGEEGIIEVKCPSSAEKMTPKEAILQKKINFATLINGKLELKKTHNYFYQIQGQLHITRRQYCHFLLWAPLGFLVEKIDRDSGKTKWNRI